MTFLGVKKYMENVIQMSDLSAQFYDFYMVLGV
jgi:hypothetical protein